ncbi:MAG TPA: hypothetical protein ENO22_01625 [candidate division Zixibacteria bacterium]|mgnify:CR=1 FL=1|nr:hypothetical protein [candidate division Zixibacteria bacterium]HEQ98021.1 hypothetical protein [candidate division Zixibacteria bacterium]
MSSYTWEEGLIINVNSILLAYEPDKYRRIRWFDDNANSISMEYTLDSNGLAMLAIVDGIPVIDDTVEIETSEWNGEDGLWHELSIELIGDQIYGLRDDKVLFEAADSRILNYTHTGHLEISGLSAQLCFDDISFVSLVQPPVLCGDANNDNSVNVSDAVNIINFVFAGGNPPNPYEAGDTNCDGTANVSDAVWIINYVFVGGSAPCDTDGNGDPEC